MIAKTLTTVSVVLRVVLIRISRGTLVSHVGVKTGPPVGAVSDDLRSTVRKLHSILAVHGLAVAGLLPTEIVSGSMILHGIAELIGLGLKQNTSDREFPFSLSAPKTVEKNVKKERGRERKECEMWKYRDK